MDDDVSIGARRLMLGNDSALASANRAVACLPWLVLFVSASACALAWGRPPFDTVVAWSVPATVIVLPLLRRIDFRPPPTISSAGFASFAWALNAGVAMLVVPVLLLRWPNWLNNYGGWTYPVLDKRSLAACYVIGVVTLLVAPVAIRRLWLPGLTFAQAAVVPSRFVWKIAGSAVVIALAWFMAGPPWNAERHHRPIDFHEQVHLGPLQAIDKGMMPFVGPAATQYGPGSQLMTYAYMKLRGRFSVVGFREANLLFNFVTFVTVGLIAVWQIDAISAVVVMLLALTYSPLTFFRPAVDGTFSGFYGWGNALRYLGALIVVPLAALWALDARADQWSRRHFVLGVVWGAFAWIAQENLSATGTALGLSLAVLLFSGAVPFAASIRIGASIVAGFAAFWLPLLLVYTLAGAPIEFVANYFRVARAITQGFQNTWWNEGSQGYAAYRFTPLFLAVIGLATLWDVRTLQLRAMTRESARLFAYMAVLAGSYMTVLYRSDSTHLVNTLLALPILLVLLLRDFPSIVSASPFSRAAIRVAVIAVVVPMFHLGPTLLDIRVALIDPGSIRFGSLDVPPPPALGDGVAFARAGAYLQDEPSVVAGGVPMRQFLQEASALRDVVGDRPTYIVDVGSVYTGLVYFLADLTPVRGLLERETMQIHSGVQNAVIEEFRRRVREVKCLIVIERGKLEEKAFLAAYPQAVILPMPLGSRTLSVLLAD